MNIRLSKGQLRIRLTKEEAGLALEDGFTKEEFRLPNKALISCSLCCNETVDGFQAVLDECKITATISKVLLQSLLDGGPSKNATIAYKGADDFTYTLEIDLFSFKEKKAKQL